MDNLAAELDAFRARFRRAPLGVWETDGGLVPMGDEWEFRGDGSGELVECRGFGHRTIPFEWREAGNLTIDMKFDQNLLYEGSEDAQLGSGKDWETVVYDFKIITARHNAGVSYEAVVMTGFWWSFEPLIYIGAGTSMAVTQADSSI